MPSLSTRAGTPRDSNTNIEYLEYADFERHATVNGNTTIFDNGRFWVSTFADIVNGYDIPNYHQRKNNGELLPYTPWLRVSCIQTDSFGPQAWGTTDGNTSYFLRSTNGKDSPFLPVRAGGIPPFTYPVYWSVNNWVREKVDPHIFVQAAAAKLYSRGWDTLTFVAEFRQVLRMFKNILKSAIALATSPGGLRDAWLQGRYGWRVLVFDILEANKVINSLDEEIRERNKDRTGTNMDWVTEVVTNNSFGSADESVVVRIDHELGVRGSIIADFIPPKFQTNVAVTAWELVPYSFVVDWFFSVGTALNAMSFLVLNHNYTASWGYHYNHTRTYTKTVVPKAGWWHNSDGYNVEEVSVKYRHPTTVPFLPQMNVNLNEFKIVDLLALIAQRLF